MVEQQPILFALTGSGVHLTYSSTSISGKPQLTYQDSGQTRQFSGDEIRRLDHPDLGTLVSVSLVKTVDAGSTSLTVVVPRVALPGRTPRPPAHDRGARAAPAHRRHPPGGSTRLLPGAETARDSLAGRLLAPP